MSRLHDGAPALAQHLHESLYAAGDESDDRAGDGNADGPVQDCDNSLAPTRFLAVINDLGKRTPDCLKVSALPRSGSIQKADLGNQRLDQGHDYGNQHRRHEQQKHEPSATRETIVEAGAEASEEGRLGTVWRGGHV